MSKGFLDHKDFNNPKERTILRHNATIVTKDVRHSILRPHLISPGHNIWPVVPVISVGGLWAEQLAIRCGRSFECLTSFVTIVALWRSIVLSFESLKKLCSKNPFEIESKFSIRKIFDLIQNTCNFLAYKRLGIYSTNCQNLRLILHKFWRFSKN